MTSISRNTAPEAAPEATPEAAPFAGNAAEDAAVEAFIRRWASSGGAERANAQSFLNELADVLGVERPRPTTGDPAADGYVFERPLAFQDGTQGRGFIDLYKRGCFVLETKQGADNERAASGRPLRKGHGTRGSAAWHAAMDAARGQAEGYARNLEATEPPPPFVVVADVGHCVDLFADFSGSGRLYRPFPDAGRHRIFLPALRDADTRATLAAVFTDPLALDPARRQARVTLDLARRLARLAQSLDTATDADGRPMDAEAVAGFLSRCLFAMFAEDAGLLPDDAFTRLLAAYADDLDALPLALADFFATMDAGGYVGEVRARLRRFNGLLFKDTRAPRLSPEQYAHLLDASRAHWADVEPSIFGTLLERALDPAERHALGAHFTPRATVERLVGPAVLEPLREEWDGARAAATRLVEQAEAARDARNDALATRRRNEARATLSAFLTRLASVRVLDPACGSGNFLYVTLAGLKALEDEARRVSERLVGEAVGEGFGVTPRQMRGIELNARAAAIADLVLWIGFLQWHRGRYGAAQPLPEPVLEGYGQVEHRDAVLGPDGAPAPWPDAEFIVGNPPFLGAGAMRGALGDGYTEALRRAYPDVPESADLVMFWWDRAAEAVRAGRAERFGLITTNSLSQTFNRRVVARHLDADRDPLALAFAVPDHPWTDAADGAAVRVAMTVGVRADRFDADAGRRAVVVREMPGAGGQADVDLDETRGRIHADLTTGADVTAAEPLDANRNLSNRGVQLFGSGFIVTPDEAQALGLGRVPGLEAHIRPYRNGRDLTTSPRGVLVIDLFGLSADEARERFPEVYEHVLRTVKPERDANRRASRRDNWWLFGETNPKLRRQLAGLSRYIATSETAKHRLFQFLDAAILPDNMLVCIALDDAFHLGVLSSRVHEVWALAAGGTLEDRPRYNKTRTFEPFPFPAASAEQTQKIRALGEGIDAHRKQRQSKTPSLGLTDLYNAVEALRAGRALTPKEQTSAEAGLAHTLLDLHRRLDRAVLDAYGWADLDAEAPGFAPAVLERLVALNAARRAEEAAGRVRWLRPSFQAPGAAQGGLGLASVAPAAAATPAARPWPETLAARTVAVRQAVAGGARTPEAVAARFAGARDRD
ncbi:MAG: class I SAM-dependent DNA methyltransferase, partial [Rubricoccaceae bacterium]